VPDRPDLILVMTDQQRADQLGYASDGYFETPNLDRLADSGVIFDTAYSDAPVCVPARMAMLTGLHHHRLPTQINDLALQEGFWTSVHALRAAGYQTALVGKMHFAPVHADHGFEIMQVAEHMSGLVAKQGAEAELDDYHDWLASRGEPDWRFEREARGEAQRAGRSVGEPPAVLDEYVHPTSWI
jgi:arylsulfatase A-like enzyme